MAKELIFLFLFTSLPDLLQAQNTKDDLSLAKELRVTEIRRVMPKDSETKDAKNYATQVTIEDSNLSKGNFTFKLSFNDDGGYSKSAEKNVTLDNNSTVRIIFDTTIPDQASKQLLIAMLGNETKGVWKGKFLITDIKARVAVIAENYLRVTTGELNKVTFVGRPELICSNTSSPCYYSRRQFVNFPPDTKRCKDLENGENRLAYCDDTVTESLGLPDEPTLLLLDEKILNLKYPATNNTYEVLMAEKDSQLDMEHVFKCSNEEIHNNWCNINISILGKEVNFTITTIDENDFVEGSNTRYFNVIPVQVMRLTEDSVFASWETHLEPAFEVFIKTKTNLDDFDYELNTTCGTSDAENRCESLFINVGKDENHIVVVQQGNNAVAKTIQGDPTEQLKIYRISKTEGMTYNLTFMVESNSIENLPTVELIEVNVLDDNTVVNQFYSGTSIKTSRGYGFKSTEVNVTYNSERKFYLVGYNESEIPVRCGVTYVTFEEFDVELEWIAKSRILRESVRNDKNVLVGDEYCNKSVSACYHSTFPDVVEYVPLCTEEVNFAGGTQTDILLCEDQKPENTEGFTVNKLQLQEEDDGKISLSAPCVENSRHVGLALYSSGIPLDSAESECLKGPNSTCSADSLHLSASSAHLDVVVVCISENNVTTSSIVPVEDLKVTSKKMDEKSMLVHWTVANADDYVVLLETDEDVPARVGKKLTSEITCDNEDSCYSTFFDLDLKLEHQLIIHKQGDNTSVTETHIDPLDDEKDPDSVHIEKVSRVCDNETKVFLKEKCKHDVTILAKIFEKTSTSGIDMSGRGKALDFTDMIFTFTHDETIFDKKSVTFSVLDSEEDTLSHTGIASISLYRLNADVAWVGAEGNTDKASLRVDVGNLDQVKFEGGLKCEKENSPCYFFEVKSSALVLPKVFERCAPSDPGDVSQCDEEVTPFQAMDERDVNITLEDNVLKVVAPLSENNGHIEIKTYDPSNLETNFSKGAVNCTGNALKNTDMVMCRQPVQLPNGQSYIKVIVAEVNVNGKTLKSIVKEINVPSFGVESWVIAVSVLSFLVFASTGSYLIIVGVKKKKLQKWESDAIKKVKTIDTIGKSNTDQDLSRARSDSISDSSISLPERDMFSQRSPPPFRRPDNFPEQPFPRAIDRGYPVERVSHNLKSLPPPEIHNEMRPVNYLKPQPPLGRNNEAFVSTESDSVTDSQLTRLQKVNLSSRVNLSSLQARMSQYKQTRV